MEIVRLYDERKLMAELKDDTVICIHSTTIITAIKKLLYAHEIIELNLKIHEKFSSLDQPIWDRSALTDLRTVRSELVLFHRADFKPLEVIDSYNIKMKKLFHSIEFREAS